MGVLLSDHELSQTQGAEHVPFQSPLPTVMISNGEYNPVPQNEKQKAVESVLAEMSDAKARKLNVSRRGFLASAAGMATAFLAMNKVYGPLFQVNEAEAADPAVARERVAALKDQFILDDQLHFIRDDFDWQPLVQIMSYGKKWNPDWDKKGMTLERFKHKNFVQEVYLDSDTKVGLISSAPFDEAKLVILNNAQMAEARARVNAEAGSRRALCHAVVRPGQDGWMAEVDEAIEKHKPNSWKGYTIGDPFGMSKFPWRLDDEKLVYPFYEKAVKAGITTVCIHKGLVPTEMVDKAPQLLDFVKVPDLVKAAKDWPQINFVIYHSAYRMAIESPDKLLDEFENTGYIQWSTDLARVVSENGLRNVHAELGTCFANTCVTHPRLAAALVGTLIKGVGADRVVWGTDSVWWGSPQWQIEALRRLEIPQDMRMKHGFKRLGDADGPVKSAIFGGNSARLYNVDVKQATQAIQGDRFAQERARRIAEDVPRTNLAFGYILK